MNELAKEIPKPLLTKVIRGRKNSVVTLQVVMDLCKVLMYFGYPALVPEETKSCMYILIQFWIMMTFET